MRRFRHRRKHQARRFFPVRYGSFLVFGFGPRTLGLTRCLVTRIKKIIRLDDDIAQCSNNAAFVISVATVGFLLPWPLSIGSVYFTPCLLTMMTGDVHTISSGAGS